ncbi:MAG: CaiB/BaiF CoA transferase family protein, partial [Ktedonobacterales bacterium]
AAKVGISVADISAGMYAYSGILTALYQRERTGMGAALEVSLFDALGEWMSHPAYYTAYGSHQPACSGASPATIAPYGPFRAGDGSLTYLAIQNEREWVRFCAVVLERPELAIDPRFTSNAGRVAQREALQEAIELALSTLTGAQVLARLERAQIANARLNDMRDFWEHPQLAARDRWREVESPVGTLRALLPPVTMAGAAPHMGAIPALGEQTEPILRELGYSHEQIARLRAEQAI